MLSFSVIK